MHFEAHKPFYSFVGIASIAAGVVFMAVSAAYTGGAIPSPDAAQLAFQFAIISGIALLIGAVGLAMMFSWAHGFVLGFSMLISGASFLIFYNDPYNAYVALYGHVSMSAGIVAIIFHLFFYRFVHWRVTFNKGPLTVHGVSQSLGFYGVLTAIFLGLGLLGYYVLLDAPPFPF
jgi:hypothetical protein